MRKAIALAAAMLILGAVAALAQSGVTGFWRTIDDETGKPKSVVAIYEHQGKLYGRVILSYEDDGVRIKDDIHTQRRRSPYLVGEPAFCGLDVIWELEQARGKWRGGSIMDPGDQEKEPKIYGAELWREGSDLIVRGKIAFLGRNQTWKPFRASDFPAGFQVPNPGTFRPEIPRTK